MYLAFMGSRIGNWYHFDMNRCCDRFCRLDFPPTHHIGMAGY
jgi:hypothetical protein